MTPARIHALARWFLTSGGAAHSVHDQRFHEQLLRVPRHELNFDQRSRQLRDRRTSQR